MQAEGRACVKAQRPEHAAGRPDGVRCRQSTDAADLSWGHTKQSHGPFEVANSTLGQWEAMESFQQRRGVIRFDLEIPLWLGRGRRIGGTDEKVTVAWLRSDNRNGKRWTGSKSTEQQALVTTAPSSW